MYLENRPNEEKYQVQCSAVHVVTTLIRNTVGHQLELIISLSRNTHVGLANKIPNILRSISLILIQDKAIPEILQRLRLEAWQTTIKHQ